MTTYLTVRDLTEQLQRIDPDARVELEVRHVVPEDSLVQEGDWTETEPLLDLDVRTCGKRYVTLRGCA